MYKEINFSDFCDEFKGGQYENQFTYEGKRALFDYLEEYEENTGERIELDIVAICCDYTEYENFKELQKDYEGIRNMEELEENTTVIKIAGSDSLIIQQF